MKCPYCERIFNIVSIGIKGDSYKCVYCKVWFKYDYITEKITKRDYII